MSAWTETRWTEATEDLVLDLLAAHDPENLLGWSVATDDILTSLYAAGVLMTPAMRAVYDAALAWRRSHGSSVDVIVDGTPGRTISADERALRIVTDRAIEATP